MRDLREILGPPNVERLLDTLDALVVTLDHEGTIVSFNGACERATGYRADEVLGRPLWEVAILPDEANAVRKTFANLVAGQFPNRHSNHWRTKAGGRRWIHWSNTALCDSDGTVRYVVGTGIDLTENIELLDSLSASEAQYRMLLDHHPDVIAVHRDGRVVYANVACAKVLQWESPKELVGTPIIALVHPEDRPGVMRRVALAVNSSVPQPPLEERFLARDGSVVYAEVVTLRVLFDGEPAIFAAARDVSARRHITEQAIRIDRLITAGTLMAGMAHEINNPLTLVHADLEEVLTLLDDLTAASSSVQSSELSQVRALVAESLDGAKRVRDIVGDLKNLDPKESEQSRPFPLATVVNAALGMVRNELRHRTVVEVDLPDALYVHGHSGRCVQVLVNLLLNAAHSIESGAVAQNSVVIKAVDEAGMVRLSVSDSGSGIPRHLLSRLFEPFYTTKPTASGAGLGLSLSRQFMIAMGGELGVDSTEGVGTTAWMAIPLGASEAASPVDEGLVDASPTQRRQLLIIDGNADVRRALARMLHRHHDVETVATGEAALKLLAQGRSFDLILCDLMMPEMTGMAFAGSVERHHPQHYERLAFMSGGVFTHEARHFLAKNHSRFIDKPMSSVGLLRFVDQMTQGD